MLEVYLLETILWPSLPNYRQAGIVHYPHMITSLTVFAFEFNSRAVLFSFLLRIVATTALNKLQNYVQIRSILCEVEYSPAAGNLVGLGHLYLQKSNSLLQI